MKRAPIRIHLTADFVRGLFDYDPHTSLLFRKKRPNVIPGIAGCGWHDYVGIKIHRERYMAHRVIWLMITGKWPIAEIDHINGIKSDNRWSNLREATRSQNMGNSRRKKPGKLKGACFHRRIGKWQATIRENGKQKTLGYFETEQEAHDVYWQAAQRIYGKFARAA